MITTTPDDVRGQPSGSASRQVNKAARRTIVPRRNLPSGRAVVGALLVTLSGLGLYAANQAATASPHSTWIVARHRIPTGHRITAADLGLARMQLIDETEAVSFSDPADVIGRRALSELEPNELVQHSDIARRMQPSGSARRLTLELTRAQALDGQLATGDRVDIVATGAEPGSTRLIVSGALVAGVNVGSADSVGSSAAVRVALVVADEDAAQLMIDSSEHGKVTLIVAADDGGN